MDHDREQASKPQSLVGDTRLTDLPSGAIFEVAKGLTTDDPVETAKNLTSFKLISRSVLDAVQTGPVGAFQGRLNRLGTSGRALYDAADPHSAEPEPDHPISLLWTAARKLDAIGPIFKFQSDRRKSATVDHILDLSRRGLNPDAIQSIAARLGDLDHVNRRRLIDQTIELFKENRPSWYVNSLEHKLAAATLISVHHYLDADHKIRIYDALIARPELAEILGGMAEHVAPFQKDSTSRNTETPQSSELDGSIEAISKSSCELLANRGIDETERLDAILEIGKSIDKAYNDARAALLGSVRSRGTNLGR
ncbi:hypothetical protein [Bradyrhizobium sp. CCGUVB23]|uniref:hypothetical protein n=1 Tax=Bradyrhizobium sp. CCGUVB23 TaxID=2949630 RepID=UPI0020B45C6D|nr:hypothetical protein [Bradyrhizobium sp. CCGUVB23]MCP3468672.1 hypothetical protein [Bradyrhizobium sp. CCGUVB23]